ncbi:hypothetical protein [Aureibacter tunicatorum]|uniref:Uncharacterized protein n=1 Tax=Aureibacter tunicatorum TaxID=866807 RepID=A0AAE3XQS3_9BACT|nr:hypothetical protein [Aureibacter tunicatorum]MDR6240314.1 hypothetical protein [Aureibacter tunicatorum]BDD05805.1 hypothetical protein AUTU_32880 [Aureibacter tunicatorum]
MLKTTPYFSVLLLSLFLLTSSYTDQANANVEAISSEGTQDFIFQILDQKTNRQSNTEVNIFVKYRYSDEQNHHDHYVDYRKVRDITLGYIQISKEYPLNTTWEVLSKVIAKRIMADFKFKAISVQIQAHPRVLEDKKLTEPGYHSGIHTIGRIEPLSIVVTNK